MNPWHDEKHPCLDATDLKEHPMTRTQMTKGRGCEVAIFDIVAQEKLDKGYEVTQCSACGYDIWEHPVTPEKARKLMTKAQDAPGRQQRAVLGQDGSKDKGTGVDSGFEHKREGG